MTAGEVVAVVIAGLGLTGIFVCLLAALKAGGAADDTRFVDLPRRDDEGNGHGNGPSS